MNQLCTLELRQEACDVAYFGSDDVVAALAMKRVNLT